MKHHTAQVHEVTLETHQETGRVGAAASEIEQAGGVVLVACAIRKRIVYVSPKPLTAEIESAISGKPGDRVS